MIDPCKSYFPLSARLKIPGTTPPDAPYSIKLESQARTLEFITIAIPQASVLQDLGVRIYSNEGFLYPAIGSKTDSNFAGGKDSYGAMPTSGLALTLPFNRRMLGAPYNIILEFYNDGAAVSVNVLAVVSEEKRPMVRFESSKKESDVSTVRHTG